ncbi:MAG: hypothetical protein IJX55_04870 [Clostridia bacterium]|nr:hypothetical protein [Clostridia bacterium]
MLAAYYSPVTAQEISIELGVALPYLEDEIKLLVKRQYLVCKNGKYSANIPIFTVDCTKAIDGKLRELTESVAERFVAASDKFAKHFGGRFENENLMRWQKVLMCLHFSLIDTNNDLEKHYGELPGDGPYSLVNGGGGRGVVWGRNKETIVSDELPQGIQGIYNGCQSSGGRGKVIAMNFRQTLNAQHFEGRMTDPLVLAAEGRFEDLSDEWKNITANLGYVSGGKANFTVWSSEEYKALPQILRECTDLVSELNRKTAEIAATVTADLAPAHIRKTAEYVGALVYQFNSIENLVNALYDRGYLKPVGDREKPAICVVTK